MNVVLRPSRAPLNVAFAAEPPVLSAGGAPRSARIRPISASSTSTMPPFSPGTLERNDSGTCATRSTMGLPTPASSISGAASFIAASSRDREACRKERLVVYLDQDGVLPGLLEAQVVDLADEVDPVERPLGLERALDQGLRVGGVEAHRDPHRMGPGRDVGEHHEPDHVR